MSTNSRQVIYALECGHAAPGLPTLVNGKLRCAWHGDEQQIVGVIEYEWRAKCMSCTFARWAGLSQQNAGILASGHSRRSPEHNVIREYIRNPLAVETAAKFVAFQGRKAG